MIDFVNYITKFCKFAEVMKSMECSMLNFRRIDVLFHTNGNNDNIYIYNYVNCNGINLC